MSTMPGNTLTYSSPAAAGPRRDGSGAAVEGCSHGGAGFLGFGGPAQYVGGADGDDGAGHGPDQVDPPGGQVADGQIGAEAAGGVHRGAVVGAAHGAPGQDVGADGQGHERAV